MNTAPTCTASVAQRLQLCLPRLPIIESGDLQLSALTLDSMDTVELLCVVHEEFGVRLTERDFHPEQTIEALLAVIARKASR